MHADRQLLSAAIISSVQPYCFMRVDAAKKQAEKDKKIEYGDFSVPGETPSWGTGSSAWGRGGLSSSNPYNQILEAQRKSEQQLAAWKRRH